MKRNRQLTYNQSFAYFIATTLSGFVELFTEDAYAQIIIRNSNFYREKYEFKLLAYVIMPKYIHLIIFPGSERNDSEILRDFKKYTAREIIQLLEEERQFDILAIFHKMSQMHHQKENRQYQIWEDRFDDLAVYSDRVFQTRLNYIHNNPVKAGMLDNPGDYLYSSAGNYDYDDHSVIRVDCGTGASFAEEDPGIKDFVMSGHLTPTP